MASSTTKSKGKRSRTVTAAAMTAAGDPSPSASGPPVVHSSSSETYLANPNGTSVRRIRTPHPHDVLSGRGGGINSHPGNVQFRLWVADRKNDYNLALSKNEKAEVARQVIARVKSQNPPGRFLTKDPSTCSVGNLAGWWVELDEERMMAKTAQALREGAPAIRAEHADELFELKREVGEHRQRQRHSHHQHQNQHSRKRGGDEALLGAEPNLDESFRAAVVLPQKRVRVDYNGRAVHPSDETPPLLPSAPEERQVPPVLSLADLPPLEDHRIFPLPLPKRAGSMSRAHSLAFSEEGMGLGEWTQDDEFVNPFESEDEIVRLEAIRNATLVPPPLPSRSGFSTTHHDVSTGSHGDMGGMSALFPGSNSRHAYHRSSSSSNEIANHAANNNHSVRSRNSTGNMSSRYDDPEQRIVDFWPVDKDVDFDASDSQLLMFNGDSLSAPEYLQWWEYPIIPRSVSLVSLTSVLSDLPDPSLGIYVPHETDFMEGMKGIYDALHADDYGESLCPSFQLPFHQRGGNNGFLMSNHHHRLARRSSSMASRGNDGRQ